MKTQSVTTLAVFLAIAPPAIAQRGQSNGGARPQQSQIQRAPERPNLPTSPILPMTNPVLPMTNPIQPVIRYGVGGTPTVVIPTQDRSRDNRSDDRRPDDRRSDDRNRRDRDVPVVVIGGPYIDPYYYPPFYNQPVVSAPPVPGQLPATYVSQQPQVIYVPVPTPSPAAVPFSEEPAAVSEPRMIITPPEPERVLEPPALGTSRAEVLLKYGQPWGSIVTQGKETLYFRNLTLILEGGKVTQIR